MDSVELHMMIGPFGTLAENLCGCVHVRKHLMPNDEYVMKKKKWRKQMAVFIFIDLPYGE